MQGLGKSGADASTEREPRQWTAGPRAPALDNRGRGAHVIRMERSAHRFAWLMATLLALWSAGLVHALAPASDGALGAAAAGMEDCADCGTADAGKTVLAPCPAPCMPMAALLAVGPERSSTGAATHALLRDRGEAGRNVAPDPNPPRITLIG